MLRTVTATRYVTPLREGGSLPAIVEADDDGMYVVKFRGAGQGPKVLVAELICGELGRALGLPVPELVFVELDAAFGRNEMDGEIRGLLNASTGLNLGLDFLPGSLGFDALSLPLVTPELAAAIVWFDALITNVDRTPKNTNLLLWHRALWLIDHGAALYFHYAWPNYLARSRTPFVAIKDHVLLGGAGDLRAADERLAPLVTPALLAPILAAIPDAWLDPNAPFADLNAQRGAYLTFIQRRLEAPRAFVEEAIRVQTERF